MKKFLKFLLVLVLAALILFLAYAGYVFLSYHRIEDNQTLEVSSVTERTAETGVPYEILTFNIGFGAYEPDFGFFMDGGTESWAFSKERLTANLENIGDFLSERGADICLVQEVDSDSTRSYHVDERAIMLDALPDMNSDWAQNYNSPFLFYPFWKPHGIARSGIMTFSSFTVTDAVRIRLPIENTLYKLVDLDRCYSKQRIPVSDGRELVVYDFHLSAYTSDGKVTEEQFEMLLGDMQQEYEAGNYCIAGGDFNKDLSGDAETYYNTNAEDATWAKPLPEGAFDGTNLSLVFAYDPENPVASCRNADGPYNPDQFVLTVDGFLVSDNVTVNSSEVVDTGFAYSDHNPVSMNFTLNGTQE